MDKPKYKTIATVYINKDRKTREEYLTLTAVEGITLKAGEKLYLNKNKYKTADKHPDYVKSEKLETVNAVDRNEMPF